MTIRSAQHRVERPGIEVAPTRASFWLSPTLWIALAGSLLLWAAFPPLELWPLAWLAPLTWLWLVRLPQLPGPRPYLAIWLAGFVHWLAMLYGISLAHPALIAGWIVLSWYLAFYFPIFVALTRVAVQRLGISIVVAAPVVWVGLELVRGHFVTGFSAALLSHTQVAWPMLLQVSDLAGAYAVSFVVMLVAACAARMLPLPSESRSWTLWPAAVAALSLAATLGYGAYRLSEMPPLAESKPVRVALVQGSLDTQLESSAEQAQARMRETHAHYRELTDRARRDLSPLDLVIWPESSFVVPESLVVEPLIPPPGANLTPAEFRERIAAMNADFAAVLAAAAARANQLPDGKPQPTPTLLIVGANTWQYGAETPALYNSALMADPQGKIVGRYYKMHAVMFGEYIPLGSVFPWIYQIVPVIGMSEGDRPAAFEAAGLRMAPSICFESVVPHLIRSHVVRLQRAGTPADVLVNVTNDGWFWGSSILDHHFRCGVFRAIENRKPLLIAANTGISAHLDGSGRVLARGPRRQPAVLLAEVRPDGRPSPYHWIGDLPAWLCAAACLVLALIGWRSREKAVPREPAGK